MGLLDAEEGRRALEQSDPRFAAGDTTPAAPTPSPSLVQRFWQMLPPEVRKAYASSPDAMAWLYRNVSTPGAIQDTVEAAQDTARSAAAGEGWGTATNVVKTLGAMAGAVPGAKLVQKGGKKVVEKIAEELAAPAVKTGEKVASEVPTPGTKMTGLGGDQFKVLTEEQAQARLKDPKVKAQVKEEVAAAKAGETGRFPWAADRYPELADPVYTWDKNNEKFYLSRGTSPEAYVFNAARKEHLAQTGVADSFNPLFDPSKRFDVKGAYGKFIDTDEARMKVPKAIDKYEAQARDPEALKRLVDAYHRGEVMPGSNDWYLVGQLEAPFLKQFGQVEGAKRFREQFAESMATTTAGNDPTANFLFGSYGNYIKGQGHDVMPQSWNTPPPIGGQYMKGNLDEFQKVRMEGEPIGLGNPKRLDFTQAFLGDRNAMTMDKQMMSGMYNLPVPPPGAYGHFSRAAREVAEKEGVDPRAYQDVPWHGFKVEKEPGLVPQPMVQNVNQAMERSARMAGGTAEDAYRRFMKYGPVYGIGGLGVGSLAVPGLLDDSESY